MTLRRLRLGLVIPTLLGLFLMAPGHRLTAADAANPDAPNAATVLNLEGSAQIQEDQDWRALEEGEPLDAGDRVRTGADSSLHLLLADGSSLVLGPNSEATLDSLGDGQAGSETFVGLVNGLVNAMVEHLKPGARFEVNTDNAVAAVKGTDFEVSASADAGAAVTVNNGVVQLGDRAGMHFAPVAPGEQRVFFNGRLGLARRLRADEFHAFQARWARAHAWHQDRLRRFQRLRPLMRAQRRRFMQRLQRRRAWHQRMGVNTGHRPGLAAREGRQQRRGRRPAARRPEQKRRAQEKRRQDPPKHEN
ncbi:MAG TPA: FecR family protein [bacterium]|nr:FecR family protein [bacterium]